MYNISGYLSARGIVDGSNCNIHTQANTTKDKICYCRVSSHGQRDDLQRQVQRMREDFPDHRIITDIGSGINFKRRGLQTILERTCSGLVSEVVVAYRDRLCRFAFELLERIFCINHVRLVVLHEGVEGRGDNTNNELAEDLLAIVNVFTCRVNGRRKYAKKQGQAQLVVKEEGPLATTKQGAEV